MKKTAFLFLFLFFACASRATDTADSSKRNTFVGSTVYHLTYVYTPSNTLYEGQFESLRSGFPLVVGLCLARKKLQFAGGVKLPMFTTAKFKFALNAEIRYHPGFKIRKLLPYFLLNADFTRYENIYGLWKVLIWPAGPELYSNRVENRVRVYNASTGIGLSYRVERVQKGRMNLFIDLSAGAFTKNQSYMISDRDVALTYKEEMFSRYYFSMMAKGGMNVFF